MQHLTAGDEKITPTQQERTLHMLIEGLRERELMMKRDQIITSILEDAPRSFTKLMAKDAIGKELASEERIRSSTKSNFYPSDGRAKNAQKNFFKALEEEHRLISRENMQLLGLTIQKISCLPKSKKSFAQNSDGLNGTVHTHGLLNLQNCENIPEGEKSIDKKLMSNQRLRDVVKRPQSIRVREKAPRSPERRRQSTRPLGSEYANSIYEARILSYRQLLFKLQWSYGVYLKMDGEEEFKNDRKYKAWVGGGNNSYLVKELIKRRFWWQLTEQRNYDVNFMWTQLKVPDYFKKQTQAPLWLMSETIRKPEQTKNLSEKQVSRDKLARSRDKREREKEKQLLKQDQYLSKIMPQFESASFQTAIRQCKGRSLYERQKLMSGRQVSSEGERVHNHLTANFHLGNKKALFYNLKYYYELMGGNLFKAIPLTFHIKKGCKDPQYKRFLAYHRKRQAHIKRQQKEMQNGSTVNRLMRNIWIVKPGELTNRGNGITVIDEVYELDGIIKSQRNHQNGIEKTFIVQLYIDRPFLYKKRKFDIRHYLMISQIHGVFKAYWFKEGYIRTASYQFDVQNLDREIHLTNDAVQKYTPYYGKYELANKVSYTEFQKYLDGKYQKEKYSFEEQILPRMRAIAKDAVRSTFLKLSPQRCKHNFEIFGLDFMIDSEFVPWLIEFNTNPCLELVCPLLTRIIPQMLDQALRLTLDVVYPPPTHYPNTTKHLVPDSSLESLKWELLFDERVEGQELRQLYKGCRGDLMQEIGEVSDDQVYEDQANGNITLEELL